MYLYRRYTFDLDVTVSQQTEGVRLVALEDATLIRNASIVANLASAIIRDRVYVALCRAPPGRSVTVGSSSEDADAGSRLTTTLLSPSSAIMEGFAASSCH